VDEDVERYDGNHHRDNLEQPGLGDKSEVDTICQGLHEIKE
jgi:hypothetical protein